MNGQRINVSTCDFGSIVGALNFNHLDIKIPRFNDEMQYNPLEFLDDLEKFFRVKNVKEKMMSTVEIALEGKAKLWLSLQDDINSYIQFRDLFTKEFYSIPIQVKVKVPGQIENIMIKTETFKRIILNSLKKRTIFDQVW